VPRRPIPYRYHPKLRIHKGSITWYQSSALGVSLPFHSRPSSFHNRPSNSHNCLDRHRIPSSSPLPQITFGSPQRIASGSDWRRAFVGIATNHGAVTIVAKRGTFY
ncbi:hypothetical protein GW17_00038499, partial [Ensete ventricosum]